MATTELSKFELGKIFVNCARRIEDDPTDSKYKVRYIVLYPMMHPAVFPMKQNQGLLLGSSVEDCIQQFNDLEYARKNPANIDAAVLSAKNPQKLIELNKRIKNALTNECPICFEKLEPEKSFTCFHGHVFHHDCIEKLNACPVCQIKI